jgi:hypothetical protein
MKKLYELYVKNQMENNRFLPVDRVKEPLNFEEWAALLIILKEDLKHISSYRIACNEFTERFLAIPKFKLEELNFDPFHDSGGIRIRNEVFNSNNELIDAFNKVLLFIL